MFVITNAVVLVFQLFMMVMKEPFGHDHDDVDGECDAEDVDAMKGRVMTTVLLLLATCFVGLARMRP